MSHTCHKSAISNKANGVEASATLAISSLAKQMKADGKPVLSFSAGEPDFGTPSDICQAGISAIESGHTAYTPVPGIPELR